MEYKKVFRLVSRYASIMALSFIGMLLNGCSDSSDDVDEVVDDGSISKKDVVGSYSFEGYSGPLRRELEIDFDSDYTGNGTELSYDNNDDLLSAYEYVFTWKIKGGKVLLTGAAASAHSSGNTNANTSWTAEFEYKHGLLLPGKPFIEGYTKAALYDLKREDVAGYVTNCVVKYDVMNMLFNVTLKSGLSKNWSDMTIRYGGSCPGDANTWYVTGGNNISFKAKDTDVDCDRMIKAYKTLREKINNGSTLSESEQDLANTAMQVIKNHIKEVEKGNAYDVMAEIGGDAFRVNCSFEILDNELSSQGNTNQNGNNTPQVDYSATGRYNGHEYVDLGLSVRWATCNVGASNKEDYGDYYAWGETSTKNEYSWSTYIHCNRYEYRLTKYCYSSDEGYMGYTDSRTKLELDDDVANVKWGGNWRMPTKNEIDELKTKCTWKEITIDGVNGFEISSNISGFEGHAIFWPAAGYRLDNDLNSLGLGVSYWSSSLDMESPESAYCYSFATTRWGTVSGVASTSTSRCSGKPVRPVCPK